LAVSLDTLVITLNSPLVGNGVSLASMDNIGIDIISVPEPTTLSLLGAGLIGMGWIRRRKRTA
jgi:hypothetical protein